MPSRILDQIDLEFSEFEQNIITEGDNSIREDARRLRILINANKDKRHPQDITDASDLFRDIRKNFL